MTPCKKESSFSCTLESLASLSIYLLSTLHCCDSDGTQTHDLQNRNLILYSTELPSHLRYKFLAKLRIFIEILYFIEKFYSIF